MKTTEDAVELATAMVRIGNHVGRNTMAVISDMNQPLGCAIGNALEVKEAIEVLRGNGPEDISELSAALAGMMAYLGEKAATPEEGIAMAKEKIADRLKEAIFSVYSPISWRMRANRDLASGGIRES